MIRPTGGKHLQEDGLNLLLSIEYYLGWWSVNVISLTFDLDIRSHKDRLTRLRPLKCPLREGYHPVPGSTGDSHWALEALGPFGHTGRLIT